MALIGIVFIILGILIKNLKMYNLIAGYNTMLKEEKERIDIEAVAVLFRNVMFLLGGYLIAAEVIVLYVDIPFLENYSIYAVLPAVLYLMIASNSKKYRLDNKK